MNKPSKVKVALNLFYISLIGIYLVTAFIIVTNFQNVLFAVRRPDMMEAARKVESEEQRAIADKIKQTREETLKKMLSPLVINENK